jgi:hypothetical protein
LEECIASIIRRERTVVMMEVIRSSEMLVLTRATWHHIPGDGILQDTVMVLSFKLRYVTLPNIPNGMLSPKSPHLATANESLVKT